MHLFSLKRLLKIILLFSVIGIIALGVNGYLYLSKNLPTLASERIVESLKTVGAEDIVIAPPEVKLLHLSLPEIRFTYRSQEIVLRKSALYWDKELFFSLIPKLLDYYGVDLPTSYDPKISKVSGKTTLLLEHDISGEISFAGALEKDTVKLHFNVAPSFLPSVINGELSQSLLKSSGSLHFQGEPTLLRDIIFHELPFLKSSDLTIKDGLAMVKGEISWGDEISQKFFLSLEDLHGDYMGLNLSGGSGEFTVEKSENGYTLSPTEVLVRKIKGGLTVKEIRASLGGEYRNNGALALDIRKLSGETLGGVIKTGAFSFPYPFTKTISVPLAAERISLKEVFTLYPSSPVKATGRIKAELPLSISPRGVAISNGKLKALSPGGEIRYESSEEQKLAASPQYRLVLQALERYRYDKLQADVALKENGELLLKTELKGKSLTLNKGREVNVNINIEQNLLELLKSLRATSRFTS